MIKSTEKLKERFDKYDKISMVVCGILILINLLSIFLLRDYIFIGSIIPCILFLIVENIGKTNRENPIDNVDLFYINVHKRFKKYRYYSFILAICLHLVANYLFHCYDLGRVLYNTSFLVGIRILVIIYIESIFFGLSAFVSNLLFKAFSPYDFRSDIIFYSKDKYLIRVWNFLYYRKEVFNSFHGVKSNFKIWRENRNIIVADNISNLKKELQSLDDDFLKKMHLYLLYPYDFGGNSEFQIDYLIDKIPKVVGFLIPIVLGYLFNDFQTLQDILIIIQLSVFAWLIWFVLVYSWNWITRKKLLDQIKVFLPLLINEELENRKLMHEGIENRKLIHEELENLKSKRKYKRPHKYK